MTNVKCFEIEAERIEELADKYNTSTAFVIEAIFDYLDGACFGTVYNVEKLLEEYLG